MRNRTMAGLPVPGSDSSGLSDKASPKGSSLSTTSMSSALNYSPSSRPGMSYSTGGFLYRKNSLPTSSLIVGNGSSSPAYGSSIYSVNLSYDSTSSIQSNSVSYNDWYKNRTSGSMTDLRQATASPILTRHDDVLKSSSLTASNDSINQEFSNMRVSPKSSTESFLDFSKPVKSAWTSDSIYNTGYSNRSYSPSWTSYSTTIPKTFTGLRSATPSPVHDLSSRSVFTRSLSSPVDFTTNSYSSVIARPTSFLSSNYSIKTPPVENKQYDILPGRPVSPDIVVTPDENLTKGTFLEKKSNLYRSRSEKDTLKNFKTISPRSEALMSTTKLRKYLKNDSNSIDLKEPSIELEVQKSPVAFLIAETNSSLSRSRSMSPTPLKAFSFQSMFESSEGTTNPDVVSKISDASQHNFSSLYNQEDVPSTVVTPEKNYYEKKKPSSEPANISWKQRRVTPTSSKSSSATELKKSGSVPSDLYTYSNYPSTGEQRTAFDDIPYNNLTETPRGRTGSIGSKSAPKIHIPSFEEYKQMRKLSELKIKLASPRASLSNHKDKKIKDISPDKVKSELDEEVSKAFASESNDSVDVNSNNKVARRKSKEGSKNSSVKLKTEEEQIKQSDERQSREDSRKSGVTRDKRSSSKSRLQRRDPVERCRSPFLIRKTLPNQQDNEIGEKERKHSEKEVQERERKTEKEELRRTKSQEENQTEAGPKRLERRHRRPASDKRKQIKEETGLSRSCSDSKAVDVKKPKQRKQRSVEDGPTPRERPHPTRHSSDREIKRKNSQGKSPRSDVSDGSLPSSGRVTPSLYVTSSLEALNEKTLVQGGVARKNRKIQHRASTLSTDSGVGGTPELEEADRLLPGSIDIERADSGVGSETNGRRVLSHCDSTTSTTSCYDCSNFFEYHQQIIPHGSEYLCEKCDGKRTTRKEAITEFVQTEVNYLEDIKVMHREFYVAMENAGLLTPEQLKTVFINLQELIEVSEKFADCLQDCVENAADEDDNDFINVNIGKLFLENLSILFPAFEAYCVNQPTGAALLKSLENEKQLLRVFLEVSQNDNRAVRRQHLKSFLMVPVQRSMRYPLLLNRIYKLTPTWHEDRERLQEGQKRTEDFLEEVNVQSQGSSATKSTIKHHGSFSTSIPSNIKAEIRKVAVDSVSWNLETVHLVHMTQLLLGPGLEQIWQKMISTPRHVPVYAVLVCTGKVERFSEIEANLPKNGMLFPHVGGDRKAAFVLVKEKTAGKCSVVREPFLLGRCIVSSESESVDEFTLTEMEGDTIDLKCENSEDCGRWLIILKHYSVQLGSWRSRRNALANIMINHTLKS